MKGYDFVPVPDEVQRSDSTPPQMRLDRRLPEHWFGQLEVVVTCEQPVHIGSGFKKCLDIGIVRETARSGRALCIPGSSFKGSIRARYEAITSSCVLSWTPKAPRQGKVGSRSHPEVQYSGLSSEVQDHDIFTKCRKEQACAACTLFGFQSGNDAQLSRVTFNDLRAPTATQVSLEAVPSAFGPRLHHLGNAQILNPDYAPRFEVTSLHGRKFAKGPTQREVEARERVEVIPMGTELRGTIGLFNLTDSELGGLLAALGIEPVGAVKIGGAKAYGLGRVSINLDKATVKDHLRRPRTWVPDQLRKSLLDSHGYCEPAESVLFALHTGSQV